jgi:AP-3 complex subunit delta
VKYVALLAMEKIVQSHPYLVSLHHDVILECIDDPDITIRSRSLDLVVGMVNSDNLATIVSRLMRQLQNTPHASNAYDPTNDRGSTGVMPTGDFDDSDAEETIRRAEVRSNQAPPLPDEYRIAVIQRILEMCSRDVYANISDFDWYLEMLVQLVRTCPSTKQTSQISSADITTMEHKVGPVDISYRIGEELQNVAVRVKSVRLESTQAAESLLLIDKRPQMFPAAGNGGRGVLEAVSWIVGEYAQLLSNPDGVMTSLLHSSVLQLPSKTIASHIQAIPKVFSRLMNGNQLSWSPERKTTASLLLARIIHFLEPLATHPMLEVQERAVEFLELMKLAAEAVSGHDVGNFDGGYVDPPLLLTQAMPSLFAGMELNPVAPGAQKKVPFPAELDIDSPINPDLQILLQRAENESVLDFEGDDNVSLLYYEKPSHTTEQPQISAAARLELQKAEYESYQQNDDQFYSDPEAITRRKAERRERNKDDPFYIAEGRSGVSTPLHNIISTNNGDELDIDAIPIMDLNLDHSRSESEAQMPVKKQKPRRKFEITADESIGGDEISSVDSSRPSSMLKSPSSHGKKSLLEVDSSGLGSLSLNEDDAILAGRKLDIERKQAEDVEMAKALKEVERLRLEMQRANERIKARDDVPEEGTLVKRKKKKVRQVVVAGENEALSTPPNVEEPGESSTVKKIKKKKKKPTGTENELTTGIMEGSETAVKPKKKKRRQIVLDEPSAA